jgi:signal transduction histidine kinase
MRPAVVRVSRIDGWVGIALATFVALLAPAELRADCAAPLATAALHALDERIDADPTGALSEARQRLAALKGSDALQEAELNAIIADAASLSDDDSAVRSAVASGRERLAHAPDSLAKRSLLLRLDLTAADSPQSATEMTASIEHLNRLEGSLPQRSLDRACLLIVRSRLNMQVVRLEEATADGLAAYRLATALGARDAIADAAQQLAFSYMRAGLLDDAASMVSEANAHYKATAETARLSNGLYIQADILKDLHDFNRALALNSEVHTLNAREHRVIDVAFDDLQRCRILLDMQRLDPARRSCLAALPVMLRAARTDLVAIVEEDLARIDIVRGQPAAAIARLDRVLASGKDQISTKTLPELYQYRSQALGNVGRFKEALRDSQEAARLTAASDAAGHSLAAASLKARVTAETAREERQALEARMHLEHQEAANQAKQSQLRLALAIAALAFLSAIAYFLWKRARQERALRAAAQTLESQAHVISTVREGVLLVDRRSRIAYANPAAAILLGRPREALLGAEVAELGIPPALLRSPGNAAPQAVASGGHELHLAGADAEPLSILLTCSPAAFYDDALTVCILQDVTELRRLERRLFSAASEERDRFGAELHEGLSQELTGVSLLLKGVAGRSRSDQGMLEYLGNLVSDLIENSRALAQGLSPVQSERGSLADALSRLAEEQMFTHGVRITCRCAIGKLQLAPWQADHIFRIAKGCVALGVRDRPQGDIALDLKVVDDALTLTVTVGSNADAGRSRDDELEWETIVHLAKIIGGTARVEALPNGGICRVAIVPLKALITSATQAHKTGPKDS